MSTFNERLARQLQSENHSVTIYTFSLQYPNFLFPGKTQLSDEPQPKDLNIKIAVNSIHPLNWWKIGNELRQLAPDIIIVRYWLPFMGPCLGTICRIAKRNQKTKIICIADNIIPHEKRFGDEWFTRYFIPAVDGFITMSSQVAEQLQLFTTKPNVLVPHPLYDNFGPGMDQQTARKQLQLREDDFVFLFFGFIRKYKGVDLLLEALSLLKERPDFARIKLVIAGEFYEDQAPYFEIIKKYNLAENIQWHNHFIADADVSAYFSAADVVVQPYRNATQSGVTPLAYHFNKPMIVTNVGGLPELVPHLEAGYVCEPQPSDIAAALSYCLTHPVSQFQSGLQTRKRMLSWENLVQSILKLANS